MAAFLLEEGRVVSGTGQVFQSEMFIGQTCRHPAARRAVKKSYLQQIRFDDLLDRIFSS
jgi:hypothetical protein